MSDNPIPPPERDFPVERLELRKQQLLSSIEADRDRRRHGLPRRRTFVIGFAALAVSGIAAALLPSGGGGPGSASAAVFNLLAARVAEQSWTPGPGQYLYLDTEGEGPAILMGRDGNCVIRSVSRDQTWLGADGSGLTRETKQAGTYTSPADRATCDAMAASGKTPANGVHSSLAARNSDVWYAPNCANYFQNIDWSRYSSDPQTLLRQIDELWHNPDATPDREFDYIEQTLAGSNPPPDVVANIYRAAALIPGVQSLGTVEDHAGRSGLGLSLATAGGTTEMIFDADTGTLLGRIDTGENASWYVSLHKEIVDALPSEPPVPLSPRCDVAGSGIFHDIPGGQVLTGPSS